MRCVIVLLAILVACSVTLCEPLDRPPAPRAESKAPYLRIRIAVPERGIVAARDDRSHFHVVIENISDRAQKITDEWNSWGYDALRFEYVTPGGDKKVMEKLGRGWPKNFFTATTLQPGELMVRDVYLDETVWTNLPVPKNKGADMNVHIHAIFEQKPDAGVEAWKGKIESPEVSITFGNMR